MAVKIKGLSDVIVNLQREVNAIEGRTRTGLSLAGAFVQGEAVAVTPVEFGTLHNSAFTVTTPPGVRPIVTTVGYTAHYAPYVHEMPLTNNFTKPGTGPKFLQKAVSENVPEIVGLIRQHAEIPGA